MKKLLDKNLKAYMLYALVVFLASVPVYYLLVDLIWRTELHEHNEIVSLRAHENFQQLSGDTAALRHSIQAWNRIQPYAPVVPAASLQEDSAYTVYRYNKLPGHEELDRFHGLITYFSAGGQAYRMTVETNIEESYETIAAITAVTAAFFLLLLGGFLLLNKRLSRKLWAPFHDTVGRLEGYDLKSQERIPLPETNIVEFGILHQGINKLIDGNLSAYREQKEFTENASHELQTPLAIVQTKLDLLLQTPGLTELQSGIIEEANRSLSRVSRINRNLVLLAKIDNGQFIGGEKLDLMELLREQTTAMEDFTEEKNLSFRLSAAPTTITGNRALTEILLTNLLTNAIRYTSPGGEIHIRIKNGMLDIANPGGSALPGDKLFRRFTSTAAHSAGTGLGQAIVHQICLVSGWQASYAYKDGRHHFRIQFNNT